MRPWPRSPTRSRTTFVRPCVREPWGCRRRTGSDEVARTSSVLGGADSRIGGPMMERDCVASRSGLVAVGVLLIALALGLAAPAGAAWAGAAVTVAPVEGQGPGASPGFMRPKGIPRTIDFTTDEGTLMSVDVAPSGKWIAFDLLGHIYRVAARGGQAECLTSGSGVALNYHPRFSPDGREIAFISDRSGQANVWLMGADGSAPHPVFLDAEHRYATPVWSRDGQLIWATRFAATPGQGWH